MRGFGAPFTDTGPNDWGFGDPAPGAWDVGDRGFGSPLGSQIAIFPAGFVVADDGGDIVPLSGDWPTRGPFRVRLKRDGLTYPNPGERLGCYSAVVFLRGGGQGTACQTDIGLKVLYFAAPPLPPGTYDAQVSWGPLWSESVLAVGAVISKYRTRNPIEYSMRSTFPEKVRTGPRMEHQERLLIETDEDAIRAAFPKNPMEVLIRAIAQEIQVCHGRPETLLTTDLTWDAGYMDVESTLAFPDKGAVFCGGRRYTYSARTDVRLSGLNPDRNDGTTIPSRSVVTLDVSSVP